MPKLFIATPCYGGGPTGWSANQYWLNVVALVNDPQVQLVPHAELIGVDIVRARSRALRIAHDEGADYLLMWDNDNFGSSAQQAAACLRGMLQSGHHLIGTPYPQKRIFWDRVAAAVAQGAKTPDELEAASQRYAFSMPQGMVQLVNGCCETTHLGMGFTLIDRYCVDRMLEQYGPGLTFNDEDPVTGRIVPTVALFQLLFMPDSLRGGMKMLSEDYSFCQRWLDMGEKVHLYLGEGSPLDHLGEYVFRGLKGAIMRKGPQS